MERPDIISGYLDDGVLTIDSSTTIGHAPSTSTMLKKIKTELNLKGIASSYQMELDNNDPEEYYDDEVRGQLPDFLYHGTNMSSLNKIVRLGLLPNQPGNWEQAGILHKNLIFGATEFPMAVFHANNSLQIYDDSGFLEYDDDFPVVIKFSIPDKNKLYPDYDVANNTIGLSSTADDLGYTSMGDYGNVYDEIVTANPEGRHWKNTGVFAYQGRIPAKFITEVYTNFFDPPYMTSTPKFGGSLKDFYENLHEIKDLD